MHAERHLRWPIASIGIAANRHLGSRHDFLDQLKTLRQGGRHRDDDQQSRSRITSMRLTKRGPRLRNHRAERIDRTPLIDPMAVGIVADANRIGRPGRTIEHGRAARTIVASPRGIDANITDPPRRKIVQGALASLIAAPAVVIPGRASAGARLVVVNTGGAMGLAKQKAIYTPFSRETGIEIVAIPGIDFGKIKLQVDSRDVEWDVVDISPSWLPAAVRLGLLEPIDERIVRRDGCIPQAWSPYAVAGSVYSSGIGFTTDRRIGRAPQTWPEFWDVARLPGRRGLRRQITDTLEIALMADGVPAAHVYPCDVDRAFRSLNRIKNSIDHWIAENEQSVSLIQQDEVDFTFTYSTRVKRMQEAGAPIGFSFKQNLLGIAWSGIVRGTPKRDAAMRLCAYIADPSRQIALSNLTGDAPTYPAALGRVSPSVRRWLPDFGRPDNLFTNPSWWDKRMDELTFRFQDWLFT